MNEKKISTILNILAKLAKNAGTDKDHIRAYYLGKGLVVMTEGESISDLGLNEEQEKYTSEYIEKTREAIKDFEPTLISHLNGRMALHFLKEEIVEKYGDLSKEQEKLYTDAMLAIDPHEFKKLEKKFREETFEE